ncbi:hypothetical protein LOTGIDRAFT_162611 [Lottia gigantea]|uniref:Uncharacterized protein n=1 Tax=Lottia gigantea TaxID=225164 RepID=V3ZLR8_LOTGI|nr:hypothetical protein LOTGIDRAFT_162611 [Lottia gigantea]ESO92308.1 hypothetical protein LOTGIDRAFT_162611 [Lottia gigantea]
MLTTPNLLDFDSLYIYTTTPEQSYYQFLKALEYLPKKDVQDIFQYYEKSKMTDWNNFLKRNREYIKAKNKIKTQVENNRLQQLGLTENLQTLFQPILKSQEDIKKKLALEPTPHIELKPIEYNGIIIRTLDDINRLFSNPDPDLPKSISPIVDNQGLLFNGFRIIFSGNSPQFKIDTKDYIYTLTKGLIDLMNGKDVGIADYKDLVAYSKFLDAIRKSRPETRRLKEVKLYKRVIEQDEEDVDDYPIIQEIDEFDDMVASGQGITFLSDDNKELLNRLEIILAAMKEGHRSDRQYNEVNAILKRLLEKEIITKKDYINIIKNVQ